MVTLSSLVSKLRTMVMCEGAAMSPERKRAILSMLEEYKSCDEDFQPYASYKDSSYTKNLVAQFGEECNVIVMCWGPGQSSQFHAHEGSRCFVKVLSGCLLEQQVPYPNEGATDCALGERRRLNTDQVCYIDDSIGAHKVSNVSTVMPAVSLHIYMPAYTSCRLFEPEATDKSTCLSIERSHTVNVTFDNVQQHS